MSEKRSPITLELPSQNLSQRLACERQLFLRTLPPCQSSWGSDQEMTTAFRCLLLSLVLVLASCLPSFVTAQERIWISEGLRGDIVARDCAGCDEDIGIMIACQGEGGPALISVPFAASNERPDDGSRITFRLDRDEFTYEATIDEQGAVGFVPQFGVRPNDPLIGALQSAREARVTFEGRETRIGLRGSGSALEIFKAHCAWTGIPFDPSPLVADRAGDVPVDGPTWFTSQYANEAGAPMIALVYGVPESDNILLVATCAAGTGARSVTFNLSLDTGAAPPGATVDALISVAGNAYTYPGKVYAESSEDAGLSFDVGSRAPLWGGLRSGGDLKFGIAGGVSVGGSAMGAATSVTTFTDACFSARAVNAPLVQLDTAPAANGVAPVVKLNLGTADTPPAAPLVKLNLGSTETKPLVELEATAPTPLIKVDLGSPPSPPGIRYHCDDGSSLSVVVETVGAMTVARLALASGEPISLAQVQSPFGEKYTDGKTTLRVSAGIIQVADGSSSQFCAQQ